jgi:hypothetical protein
LQIETLPGLEWCLQWRQAGCVFMIGYLVFDGADLGTTACGNHLRNMSNKASRQRREAALASLPRFTIRDLIGLKLMDGDWNHVDPTWLNELPPPVTLSDQVNEVRRRRAVLFDSMLDGSYEADEQP